jgi:hypothetical protein
MCENPDPAISLIYSSLCTPTTMQSARRFQEEKTTKKVVTKPKDKCFVKTEWELSCTCADGNCPVHLRPIETIFPLFKLLKNDFTRGTLTTNKN